MAEISQRPPGPGGDDAGGRIVNNDGPASADAVPAHRGLKRSDRWQRVAAWAGWAGELTVEVNVARVGEVALGVRLDTRRPAQGPPNVQQRGSPPRFQEVSELCG